MLNRGKSLWCPRLQPFQLYWCHLLCWTVPAPSHLWHISCFCFSALKLSPKAWQASVPLQPTHIRKLTPRKTTFNYWLLNSNPLFYDRTILRDVLHNSSEGIQLDCSSVAHNDTLLNNSPLISLPPFSIFLSSLPFFYLPSLKLPRLSFPIKRTQTRHTACVFLVFHYYNFQTETKLDRIIKQMPIY